MIEDRRAAIAAQLASWRHLQDTVAPYLTALEALAFRHTAMRTETELAWHDECLELLPKLFRNEDSTSGS